MNQVKNKVVTSPLVSTQQLYETERDNQVAIRAEKKETSVTMPDYSSIRSCLIRTRGKTKSDNATNILEVDVKDTLTSDKQRFLIFDNKKRNRILIFASPTSLKILSESKKWHADGIFHTKSRYFAQLYTIHAYFPPSKYDPNVDKVTFNYKLITLS